LILYIYNTIIIFKRIILTLVLGYPTLFGYNNNNENFINITFIDIYNCIIIIIINNINNNNNENFIIWII
jgi:hypothetical protein